MTVLLLDNTPGVLSRSSSPASPQETVAPTEHPASTRSEKPVGPAETENPNKNDNEGVWGDPLRDLPEWLDEFMENLVDGSVPEHGDAPSSSRELSS